MHNASLSQSSTAVGQLGIPLEEFKFLVVQIYQFPDTTLALYYSLTLCLPLPPPAPSIAIQFLSHY